METIIDFILENVGTFVVFAVIIAIARGFFKFFGDAAKEIQSAKGNLGTQREKLKELMAAMQKEGDANPTLFGTRESNTKKDREEKQRFARSQEIDVQKAIQQKERNQQRLLAPIDTGANPKQSAFTKYSSYEVDTVVDENLDMTMIGAELQKLRVQNLEQSLPGYEQLGYRVPQTKLTQIGNEEGQSVFSSENVHPEDSLPTSADAPKVMHREHPLIKRFHAPGQIRNAFILNELLNPKYTH